jgi:predicted nucleic acid-binding protein
VIVVDVNVIAYLLIHGEKTSDAQTLRRLEPEWLVPNLWRDEFLNILATYVRQGGTGIDSAKNLWRSAEVLFSVNECSADPSLVLELSDRYRVSAYDAQYLAVAIDSSLTLVTEDKALRRAAPQRCMTMREFLEPLERPSGTE